MRLLELNIMLTMKYLFNMQYNLLQNYYDTQCKLFINGHIGWLIFNELERSHACIRWRMCRVDSAT
jgi:hypothetical protein